ncbi:hypothetical protein ACHQM5_016828 [Ranunculus cassubicifolius]
MRSLTQSSSTTIHNLLRSHFLFYSTTAAHSPHRNGDLSRNVKVSVWWDIENCHIPNGVDPIKTSLNITSALRSNGIKGPVSITAFGDFIQLNKFTQESLSVTGISLNHVPNGGKNTADRALLADLVFWVSQNPPPAHLFLISGDTDFANILHRLRMYNYNILLATTDATPGVLCSAASIMWQWSQLVRGEGFGGKHFNTPPDGPFESWYDHNRKPLEDPIPEKPIHVNVHGSPDASTVCKIRKVPLATVNQIRLAVNTYPNGVHISALRSELLKKNVPLDKDLLRFKKFSLLLKSPHTAPKLKSRVNSKILVHGIREKPEPVGQLNVAQQKIAESVDLKLRECSNMVSNSIDGSRIATAESNVKTADVNENSSLSPCSPSLNINEPVSEVTTRIDSEESDKPRPKVGMFSKIVKWYSSWRNSTNADNECSKIGEEVNLGTRNSELFSEPDFWEGVLSFLHTPKGAALLSQSKTRRQLAQLLQIEGPHHLNSLDMDNLNHMVDTVISDKKWIEETISKAHPFRLMHPAQTPSSSSNRPNSNRLSSIFLDKPSPSRSLDRQRVNGKQIDTQLCGKSNGEILCDCQNLVGELFKEKPEGFCMSNFKHLFSLKYGYDIDVEKLGYSSLRALLQSIPGVVTTSCFAVPSKAKTVIPYNIENGRHSALSGRDDNCDSVWKLIEPILPTMSKTNSSNSEIREEIDMGGMNRVGFDDVSYLSEEFSDSDGESPIKDVPEERIMVSNKEEQSPLIQMLDSYYGESNEGNKKLSSEIGREWSQKNLSLISQSVIQEKKGKLVLGGKKKSDTRLHS